MSSAVTVDPAHVPSLALACEITTPVTTYRLTDSGPSPVSRGTGFFLSHDGRYFVVTNTHVLEAYAALKSAGKEKEAGVQVWSGEGETGSEVHEGYLLAANKTHRTVLGIKSVYDHKDVGLIELSSAAVKKVKKSKKFISLQDAGTAAEGDLVYYKGYPKKSAEFHGAVQKVTFGEWYDMRRVKLVHEALIVTAADSVAVYKSKDFDEDGSNLTGISGSALLNESGKLVGVVWGGENKKVTGPIYAVPVQTLRALVEQYPELKATFA